MMVFNNIYKNRTILITGHTGFKGAWLSLWLKQLGANVIGYSLDPPTQPNLFEILGLDKHVVDIRGNILDEKKLKEIVKKYQPEIIFHLAAQTLVKKSYTESKLTFETNIIGVINILEAIKECKSVKSFINVTTDKVYKNNEWYYGYREIDFLGGYDPYSSSKACSEIVTSAYRDSFFNVADFNKKHNTLIATVRAGNVIGGGDWAEFRLIPDCVKAIMEGVPIEIRNPNALRPWQFILEPLSGYLLLGQLLFEGHKKYADCWNFGPLDKNVITTKEIVKKIIGIWGHGTYNLQRNNKHHESQLLKLDISKAIYNLNWSPIYSLDETIKDTINWYKKYAQNGGMYNFSLEQIKNYTMKAMKLKIRWSQ